MRPRHLLDLELTTPPAAELVTIEQLRAHLRLDGIDIHDTRLAAYRLEAMGDLDGYSGVLGRALAQQTWTLHLPAFPACAIRLPLPPLISVDEIRYVDADGDDQVLAADQYQVLDGELAEVWPYDLAWPSTRCTPRAVSIEFTCGWAAPAPDAPWPAKLQPAISAIKLIVEDKFLGADPRRAEAVARCCAKLKLPRT